VLESHWQSARPAARLGSAAAWLLADDYCRLRWAKLYALKNRQEGPDRSCRQ
jgi:hypothetical protein